MTTVKEKVKAKIEINDNDCVILAGDFNARIGEKWGRIGNTKDKSENKEG